MNQALDQIIQQLNSVILGKQQQIKLSLCCLLAKGHLLIEDLPGMGKTSLAHALSNILGLDYQRVQFTSDLLPSDITGSTIFDPNKQTFHFHPGPLFNQVVLADEINRAGPKTQSALLEAMEEQQVSIDGKSHALPTPFFVIATQNPMHQAGTFPLPESQLDRFLMRIGLGYPDKESEKAILLGEISAAAKKVSALLTPANLVEMQSLVNSVVLSNVVVEYILDLVTETRDSQDYPMALSPRASIAIANAAKAWAFIHSRDYVIPDDVQAIFPSVAEHRLGIASNTTNKLSHDLLSKVKINP
ncbi:AAA family ATPase [Pseudoalteromonas sp. G4]|uniref:AAA family ATPase n=1 Tax=Pseudoalteromonas sp. G4 TaxID=2992761 RepID=UPI00237D715F|nr:AAA family ATPase [Pseudoalteromonas sp. G4]MDE3271316.1 AAA family ATPase [Pseudoalteromonas sp. G4]